MSPAPALAVAYSGGRDSTALLHATLVAAAAHGEGLVVHALHVHHGLSAHADDWLAHGQDQCERWARQGLPVRFHAERLALSPAAGESIEALAREARYAALRRMALAAGAELVLLAHHRRDQAETLLLQALRGAGVAGLAGMPAQARREGITWVRPWLAQPPEAIEAYVRRHRLHHITDDSNADPRFARNRLRLAVWPALSQAFPAAEATLAAAATWAQQADAAVADLARLDLDACLGARVEHGSGALSDARPEARGHDLPGAGGDAGPEVRPEALGLELARWRELAPHRAVHALRAWLQLASGRLPAASELERLLRELPGEAPASWSVCGGRLTRYRCRLRFAAAESSAKTLVRAAPPRESSLSILRAGRHRLPGWGGVLVVRRVSRGGVALTRLGALELRPRSGGEQFRGALDRPARSLKKQYQAAGVPAWQRAGPLVYAQGELVFVPGLGLDAAALAAEGQAQVSLSWEPSA